MTIAQQILTHVKGKPFSLELMDFIQKLDPNGNGEMISREEGVLFDFTDGSRLHLTAAGTFELVQ